MFLSSMLMQTSYAEELTETLGSARKRPWKTSSSFKVIKPLNRNLHNISYQSILWLPLDHIHFTFYLYFSLCCWKKRRGKQPIFMENSSCHNSFCGYSYHCWCCYSYHCCCCYSYHCQLPPFLLLLLLLLLLILLLLL